MPAFNTIITAVNGVLVCECGDPKSRSFVEVTDQVREIATAIKATNTLVETQARDINIGTNHHVPIVTQARDVEIEEP
jgi:hypothetical protein